MADRTIGGGGFYDKFHRWLIHFKNGFRLGEVGVINTYVDAMNQSLINHQRAGEALNQYFCEATGISMRYYFIFQIPAAVYPKLACRFLIV